jgi:hypothetical protein
MPRAAASLCNFRAMMDRLGRPTMRRTTASSGIPASAALICLAVPSITPACASTGFAPVFRSNYSAHVNPTHMLPILSGIVDFIAYSWVVMSVLSPKPSSRSSGSICCSTEAVSCAQLEQPSQIELPCRLLKFIVEHSRPDDHGSRAAGEAATRGNQPHGRRLAATVGHQV